MTGVVRYLPRPMTLDRDEIARGRARALRQYANAETDAERGRALVWLAHWNRLAGLAQTHALLDSSAR